jgi:hypothetical protein
MGEEKRRRLKRRLDNYYKDPRNVRATDDAAESDRIFFEEHPHRTVRVRRVCPREFPDVPSTGIIVVRQIKPGVRFRQHFPGMPVRNNGEMLSDMELDELFPEAVIKEAFAELLIWDPKNSTVIGSYPYTHTRDLTST